jgi:Dolichyl-phosphate-mannose-protein mannosyltransferase
VPVTETEVELGAGLTRALARPGVRTAALAGLAGAAIVFGIVLRVVIYRSSIGVLQGDEALWGLMARHATHGEVSAFFWGQAYGGTLEVLPVAALFSLFGTHLVLMRIVPIAFSAVAGFIVWRIGRRELGELEGIVAASLLWIWPIYSVWKMEIWSGFYGGGLVCSALVLLLTLRLDRDPSRMNVALMGLVLGVSFWESLQTIPVSVPALLWLTMRRPRVWLQAWVAVPAFALGALPWILSNLRHDWWSITQFGGGTTYTTRLHGYVSATFPMALGLRVPDSTNWLFGITVSAFVYLALGVGFGWLAWRERRQRRSLLYVVIALYPFVYALNDYTSNTGEPRYVVVLLPAVVLAVASVARTLPRAIAILTVAALLSAVGLAKWIDSQNAHSSTFAYDRGYVELAPAVSILRAAGVDRAYADYWIATRMTFDTREQIVVSEADLGNLTNEGPGRVVPPVPTNYTSSHHPAYDAAVREAPRFAYVFVEREPFEARDVRLLRANGFRESTAGTLIVLISPPQRPG